MLWHVHVKLAWLPSCGLIGEELDCMDINDKGRLCLGDSKGPVGKAAPLEGGGTEVRAHLHGHGLVHGYMYVPRHRTIILVDEVHKTVVNRSNSCTCCYLSHTLGTSWSS